MRSSIEKLWRASREGQPLARCSLFLLFFLQIISFFYYIIITLRICFYKIYGSPRALFQIPVIAVGNLSLGGTGKSVFVDWLVKKLPYKHPLVLLRGYGSEILQREQSFVVSDGVSIFKPSLVGDEALQIAQRGVCVAIGKNRYKAFLDFINHRAKTSDNVPLPDVIILDDAYQNFSLYKDYTVLLVDARAPFENGRLFPAGPMREFNYSRADLIIFTHADEVKASIPVLKKQYFPAFSEHKILAGRHAFTSFIDADGLAISLSPGTPVVICSGIAKPENIINTVQQQKLVIMHTCIYQDHYAYTQLDVIRIIKILRQQGTSILVTTEKDWTKLRTFKHFFDEALILCVVAKIEFEFLTPREYDDFMRFLQQALLCGDAQK